MKALLWLLHQTPLFFATALVAVVAGRNLELGALMSLALLGVYVLENLARIRALSPARSNLLQIAFAISLLVFPLQGSEKGNHGRMQQEIDTVEGCRVLRDIAKRQVGHDAPDLHQKDALLGAPCEAIKESARKQYPTPDQTPQVEKQSGITRAHGRIQRTIRRILINQSPIGLRSIPAPRRFFDESPPHTPKLIAPGHGLEGFHTLTTQRVLGHIVDGILR